MMLCIRVYCISPDEQIIERIKYYQQYDKQDWGYKFVKEALALEGS